MKNVIYLDILLAINLFVTYFLLISTALLLHKRPKRLRIILGAMIGSAGSLLIFCDELPWVVSAFVKILLGLVIVLASFPWQGRGVYLKTALLFIAVNFLFAGVMMALWFFAAPVEMYCRNGVVYFNISALTLAVSTVVAYFAVRLIGWIADKRVSKKTLFPITVALDGKELELSAFLDTGNRLTDPFGGTPVVICTYQAIRTLLPQTLQGYFSGKEELPRAGGEWSRRIRLVPYNVVGGSGMLRCFAPDRFSVSFSGRPESCRVLIGVSTEPLSGGEYDALLNAVLFSNSTQGVLSV